MDAWFCVGDQCPKELTRFFVAEWKDGYATGEAWCLDCYSLMENRDCAVEAACRRAVAGAFVWLWKALLPTVEGKGVVDTLRGRYP